MHKPLNIMIVDDSLIMRTNLVRSIEGLGHKVVTQATNGQESIDLYKEFKPDLVTMDITMPDMDGITAVKIIKEYDPEVNVVMVTSHGQEAMVMNALKAGAKGYILKPISAEKLKEAIGKLYPQFNDEEVDDLLEED